MRSGGPGAGVAGRDGCIYLPVLVACLICGAPHIVCKWTCTRVCTRMIMRTEAKGLPPGLHHRLCGCWGLLCSTALRTCCGGGAVTVAAFRYNMCAHVLWYIRFKRWVLSRYDDVYITIGVNIFIRNILIWSCTVVFLLMSVSFTMYLVRDDLINKWNQSISMNTLFIYQRVCNMPNISSKHYADYKSGGPELFQMIQMFVAPCLLL